MSQIKRGRSALRCQMAFLRGRFHPEVSPWTWLVIDIHKEKGWQRPGAILTNPSFVWFVKILTAAEFIALFDNVSLWSRTRCCDMVTLRCKICKIHIRIKSTSVPLYLYGNSNYCIILNVLCLTSLYLSCLYIYSKPSNRSLLAPLCLLSLQPSPHSLSPGFTGRKEKKTSIRADHLAISSTKSFHPFPKPA